MENLTEQTKTEPSTHANDYLAPEHSMGTNNVYKYMLNVVITDGARDLAETYQCYWFLDIICSYQVENKFQVEEFQVWNLKRDKQGTGAKVICDDGNGNILIEQKIPFTDFEMQTATLWNVNNTIMLPVEY